MEVCKGDGQCISKEIDGYDIICQYNCKPKDCLNSLVCNSNHANSIMANELCFSCDITFGKALTFLESANCQICYAYQVKSVKRMECDHAICLNCFKRAHYGDPPVKPAFPYDAQIEFEYRENQWDMKWVDDPIIMKYEANYEAWVEKLHSNFKECDPMRECKVCK